uniref:Uncharacterized protein n=1 Tax=Opuntia streptacantha TaxID=393608 RepID=A0A7C8YKS8_OPUST
MAIDTTKPSYWLNWRFLLCALYVLATVVIASIVIWKYEGKTRLHDEMREGQQVPVGFLYQDEVWTTCVEGIHPSWLLSFRILAFLLLMSLIVANSIIDGPGIFFFYTQWTFLLTTIFFGLASAFSIYGCWYHGGACLKGAQNIDEEQSSCPAPELGGDGWRCGAH